MASLMRPILRFALPRASPARRLAGAAFSPASMCVSSVRMGSMKYSSSPNSSSPSSPSQPPSNSPASSSPPSSPELSPEASQVLQRKLQEPHYQLSFTCVPCDHRSTHVVSKQGYHHGSVLIACPNCNNRHVISDHLNIFGDRQVTVEQLMQEKGEMVRKGVVDANGDVEFFGEEKP